MKKIKVYDFPTRIFHWLFAGLFVFAFFIAKVIDDDQPLYAYHKLAGLLVMFLVLLRIVWGLIGSKYAKFSSFRLRPSEVVEYFTSILRTKSKRYIGHNPASSYAALAMFGFAIGLVSTGVLMSKGISKDFFEEIHELCGNGFVIIAIAHVAGVILHRVKHNDGILFSMLNGQKEAVDGKSEITSSRPFVALIFIGLILTFGLYLNKSYNSKTQKLNIFGTQIKLGDGEQ